MLFYLSWIPFTLSQNNSAPFARQYMETHCSHFCCKCQCNVQHLFMVLISNYAEAQPQSGVKNTLGVHNSFFD